MPHALLAFWRVGKTTRLATSEKVGGPSVAPSRAESCSRLAWARSPSLSGRQSELQSSAASSYEPWVAPSEQATHVLPSVSGMSS
jgi:hypothetical protein